MKYIWSTYVYGIVQIRLPSFQTHHESILWISSIGKVFRAYLKILEVNKKLTKTADKNLSKVWAVFSPRSDGLNVYP
jgi:hypothetical protein